MQLALRRSVGLRGLGCATYPASMTIGQGIECAFLPYSESCLALKRLAAAECAAAAIPAPPSVKPPDVILAPGPTFGQATVDGEVVQTEQQVAELLRQQAIAAEEARKRQVAGVIDETAGTMCQRMATECGWFTSPSPDCTECVFDPLKPAFLVLFAIGMLLAFRK